MHYARMKWASVILLLTLGACQGESPDDARRTRDSTAIATASVASAEDRAAPPGTSPATDSSGRGAGGAPPAAGAPAAARDAGKARAAEATRVNRRVVLEGVDLTGVGHDRGSATAPVVVIDFSDYGCPYCAGFTRETYPALEREYVRTGKVFFKYVPFIVGMFPHSDEATRAVECAAEQGHFWTMSDRVYGAQKEWKRSSDPRTLFGQMALEDGADTTALNGCYASKRTDGRTRRASDIASQLGVRVTPSFIVAGRPVEGALPLAEFRKVIDAALLLASARR